MANVTTIPQEGQILVNIEDSKQNLKIFKKRGLPMNEVWNIVSKLLIGETLDEKYLPHQLHGDLKGQWECHIQPTGYSSGNSTTRNWYLSW